MKFRDKRLVVGYMKDLQQLARSADAAARAAGDGKATEFAQGILIAVRECGQTGQPDGEEWLNEDVWKSNMYAQGYGKAWMLMRIATTGAASGAGVPPVVLPRMD